MVLRPGGQKKLIQKKKKTAKDITVSKSGSKKKNGIVKDKNPGQTALVKVHLPLLKATI